MKFGEDIAAELCELGFNVTKRHDKSRTQYAVAAYAIRHSLAISSGRIRLDDIRFDLAV